MSMREAYCDHERGTWQVMDYTHILLMIPTPGLHTNLHHVHYMRMYKLVHVYIVGSCLAT